MNPRPRLGPSGFHARRSLVAAAATFAVGVAQAGPGDEHLELRELTLHRAGIGSFEHAAEVTGDRVFTLTFPGDAIRDVLKTMTLLDLGDGTIGPVRYGSKDPLVRRLAEFGVDISTAPGTIELFTQLRGVRIRVAAAGDVLEGTILGVESRHVSNDDVQQSHVVLITSAGVRAVPVAAIVTYELLDPSLAEELRRALNALAEERSDRTKSVELSFHGPDATPRTVVASYVREVPVWKSSYRLILPDEAESPATIQGFAIVENTTDEEWRDVRLSLAAGDPISFTMDLDQPIFADRPWMPIPLPEGLSPVVYEAGSGDAWDARRQAMRHPGGQLRMRALAGDPSQRAALLAEAAANGDSAATAATESFTVEADDLGDAQAMGEEVGDEFHFTVASPVTLPRQSSAMLPILLAPVSARRVSIYGPDAERRLFPPADAIALARLDEIELGGHRVVTIDEYDATASAVKGIELKNDTGMPLLPGPVTVFDGGAYAGDGIVTDTTRGETRLIGYGRDTSLEVRSRGDASLSTIRVRIAGGRIERSVRERQGRQYWFRNRDDRPRTVILEHPRKEGWTLIEPGPPADETESFYRFEIGVPPGEEVTVRVAQEDVERTFLEIGHGSVESAIEWHGSGLASSAVLGAVQQADDLRLVVNRVLAGMKELQRERQEIFTEQTRIRANLPLLERGSELFGRLVTKLADQESRLEELASRLAELDADLGRARAAYDDYLRDLKID